MKANPGKEPSFEQALEKLELLVTRMESGDVPLDEMVSHFEEGTRLLHFCTDKLQSAERRIEILKQERGAPLFEPFQLEEES